MRAALTALVSALLLPGPAAAAEGRAPSGLAAIADALAAEVGPPVEARRALLLAVETSAAPLGGPLEAALEATLTARGYAVTPHRGPEHAEAAARAGGQDLLLRVQAGLVPGRRELALVGELIPTWPSFFLQRRPGARAVPPRLVRARGVADAELLLLARGPRRAGEPFARAVPLARIEGRVLALAIGEPGEPGRPLIAAALPGAVVLLSPAGEVVARRELAAGERAPLRDPAATIAAGAFGEGRLAVRFAGAPQGELLALLGGGRLELVGRLAETPLCAGEAGALVGAFVDGTGLLADRLGALGGAEPSARSSRTLYAVAAAPRGGPVAFGTAGTDGRLELFGPELVTWGARAAAPLAVLTGVGAGFALADLDGDGTAEVVASLPTAAPPDRWRVLPARGGAPLAEGDGGDGLILAGAGGDLTGDGVDDAVLARVELTEAGATTSLLLVTADPRELP